MSCRFDDSFRAAGPGWNWFYSVLNAKQAKEIYQYRNTRKNCTKLTRQYGITKYAEKNKNQT